ncbi:MAG: MFS transporter [Candidatus Limnocylindrales bacterium]
MSAPIIEVVAYYLTIDRALGPSAFGLIISAYSVGSLVGALLAGRLATGRLAPHLLIGNLIVAIAVLGMAVTASLPLMAGLALVAGTSQSIVLVAYVTVRASSSPDELLGRVGSTARTISIGIQPPGLLVGGVLLDAVHGGVTLVVIAVGTALTSLVFVFSRGIRLARAVPHPHETAPA